MTIRSAASSRFALILTVSLAACSGAASLGEVFTDPPAWERYASSLEDAGLDDTALGREWIAAGTRALNDAPTVETPYRETGYLSPDRPEALAYRFSLRRGHRLTVDVALRSNEAGRVFLDLFEAVPSSDLPDRREDSPADPADAADTPDGPTDAPGAARPITTEHVASAEDASASLDVEVPRDGEYVLRLQPELLRGGRYEITIERKPMLAFPVEGAGNRDIGSGWGDPRDGGSRSHRGVDIFAPRGTPALAVEPGRVRRVGTNRLGGNTVWLSGRGDRSYYYAHLDHQAVRSGEEVATGDTVGWVGNTGNAARTPPHLHFGVRLRGGPGYVDPYPYVARVDVEPAAPSVDTTRLGDWIRSRGELNLRAAPDLGSNVVRTLPRHTVARVRAGTETWYRVELPDRSVGFVSARLTDVLEAPVARFRTAEARPVRDAPSPAAATLDSVPPGAEPPVLGRFGDWTLVRAGRGDGWVYDGDEMPAR